MDESQSLSRRQFLKVAGGGFGLGGAVALGMSLRPIAAHAKTLKIADAKDVPSICPYCAVGCATLISVKGGQIINIEGNPDSPISRGTLCPKGAASFQLAVNPLRSTKALYRKPGGATMDNEWNYVQAKLMRGLGVVAIENQARI